MSTTGSTNSNACDDCPAGKYVDTLGSDDSTDCIACLAGKYVSTSGSSSSAACDDCPAGKYADMEVDGIDPCIVCSSGTYSGPTVRGLVTITANQITLDTADDTIELGQKYQLTNDVAVSETSDCEADVEVQVKDVDVDGDNAQTTITVVRLSGDYYPGTVAGCILRPTACTSCSLGKVDTDENPSTVCEDCERGQYAPGGGVSCISCPAGQYDHDIQVDVLAGVVSIDADADQVVVEDSDIMENMHYMGGDKLQLIDADGQECSAAPLSPTGDLVISSIDNAIITFSTDITAGDADASANCKLVLPTEWRSPCIECEAGKYSSYAQTVYRCSACAAGTQAVDATGSEPVFVAHGATGCVGCEAGQYDNDAQSSEFSGGTECVDCDAGQFSAAGQTTCTTCEVGQHSGTAATTCDDCEPGQFDDDLQPATGCAACEAGKYSEAGATACQDCEAGKFANASSSFCAVCEVDTYDSDENPGTPCESCPIGQNSAGRTGLTATDGCVENVCSAFPNAETLRALGYVASASSVATQPHEFGTLTCYEAEYALSDPKVDPSATCEVAGERMVLSGCELKCETFESEDDITAQGYTVENSTAETVGALGTVGCYADTHVLRDDQTLASVTCAFALDSFRFTGCVRRAECSTMECPESYHLNSDALTSLCTSHTCRLLDRDTCCSPNTCTVEDPDPGYYPYAVENDAGETIVDLGTISCADGFMGTPSDQEFLDTTPATPEAFCLKATNSNEGNGTFTFNGCEPSVCKVVDEDTLAKQGYTVANTSVLGVYATVEDMGVVNCSAGFTTVDGVAPTVTCGWDGVLPVADFKFSGCVEITCMAPATGPLEDDAGDFNKEQSRYVIEETATNASNLVIECAPEFTGTASALCLEFSTGFTFSGCEWRTCAPRDEVTGYKIDNVNATVADQFVRGVNFACDVGFTGYPTREGCTEDGGEIQFSGCAQLPDKTSGAATVGARAAERGLLAALLLVVNLLQCI